MVRRENCRINTLLKMGDAERNAQNGEHGKPRDAERLTAWLQAFGTEPPQRQNDEMAPVIDGGAVQEMLDFVRGEASPEAGQKMTDLCLRFRCWARKLTELCLD